MKTINGNVTLSGKVPDYDTEKRLISTVRSIKSVNEVKSKLEIDKSVRSLKGLTSDNAILVAIKLKYFEDEKLNAADLHVKIINREVTLTGVVSDQGSKERAIAIASATNGVKKVISNLNVKDNLS